MKTDCMPIIKTGLKLQVHSSGKTTCPTLKSGPALMGSNGAVTAAQVFDTIATHWNHLRSSGVSNFEGVTSPHEFTRGSVVELFAEGDDVPLEKLSLCKVSRLRGLQRRAIEAFLRKPDQWLEQTAAKVEEPVRAQVRSSITTESTSVTPTPAERMTQALRAGVAQQTGVEIAAPSTVAAAQASLGATEQQTRRVGNQLFYVATIDGETAAVVATTTGVRAQAKGTS